MEPPDGWEEIDGALQREFRFNDQMVWGLIVGLVILLLPNLTPLRAFGINLILFFGALYLLCGIGGTLLWLNPAWMTTTAIYRLAGLLLYQGFLLGPVMGVGIFLFPRLLGNAFGDPGPAVSSLCRRAPGEAAPAGGRGRRVAQRHPLRKGRGGASLARPLARRRDRPRREACASDRPDRRTTIAAVQRLTSAELLTL